MKARVLFATITGNNEDVADIIIQTLRDEQVETTKEDISRIDPYDIDPGKTDIIVVVPYTFDNGSLPDEGLDFYEDLPDVDLSGMIYGISGSGDDFYGDDFAVAVDKFEKQFDKTGAEQGAKGVKVNLNPDAKETQVLQQFARQLIKSAQNR